MKSASIIPDMASHYTTQEALLYELRQLYYSQIIGLNKQRDLQRVGCVQPDDLIPGYFGSEAMKLQVLENIFKYLMVEPLQACTEIITELTDEAIPLLSYSGNPRLHQISTIGYLQVINAYRISGYRTAYAFAAQLGLDIITEELQQLLELEISAGLELADAATECMHAQSA
jgi:hypothetical protein